jgi:hypothetical protein
MCHLCSASWGWASNAPILVQPTDITRTQYTKYHLCTTSWGWASNARNMQRLLILNKLNKKCIMLVALYWYTMMHGQQNIKQVKLVPTQHYIHIIELKTDWNKNTTVLKCTNNFHIYKEVRSPSVLSAFYYKPIQFRISHFPDLKVFSLEIWQTPWKGYHPTAMPIYSNTNTEKCRHTSTSETGFKPTTPVLEEYKTVHASVHINL